ncbi:MAG: endonuclease/exonuclease/phosphatase family protein [Marinoscillum sp.]
MPFITDTPPSSIIDEITLLNKNLDALIPAKKLDQNVLIASWNIRAFGGLTEKWEADEDDSPKRDLHALLAIANIVKRFDIIAVQEVKGNLKAFRHMLKLLGNDWSFILTDVCGGDEGNDERLAFLFDSRKVKLSGLACELVVPNQQIDAIEEDAFKRQFVRTPYAVGFKVGNKTFVLVTLHVIYGSSASDRTPELKAIAEWLRNWATDMNAFDQSLIVMGDFNIDRHGDPRYEVFVSTGLKVPEDLHNLPRTVYENSTKFYDQIAWFQDHQNVSQLSIDYVKGGIFNFVPHVLRDCGLTTSQLSWRVSDHLPLWAEFSTNK